MQTNYHSIQALSNSSLSVLKRSPAEFYARFIAKTMKSEETDAMRLGSAVHMLALEPERFHDHYVIETGPINATTGKPYGRDTKRFEAWLDIRKTETSKTVLIYDEFESSMAIAEAFQSHPTIAAIMAANVEKIYERGYQMQYLVEGEQPIDIKCKPDCVIPSEALIIDLKTTSDPSPAAWRWSAEDFGYHRQAAIYLDAMETFYGKPFRFLFGVVRSKAPYEVGVFELAQESIDRGRREYGSLIAEYTRRKATGDWLSDWQRDIATINVPERKKW